MCYITGHYEYGKYNNTGTGEPADCDSAGPEYGPVESKRVIVGSKSLIVESKRDIVGSKCFAGGSEQ